MRLDGILLYVRDVNNSANFYCTILNAKLSSKPADHFVIIEFGGAFIYLHEDNNQSTETLAVSESRSTRGDGAIIHFQVDDVDEWANHCMACRHPIEKGPVTQVFGRRQCYIRDPDGYVLVIEQRL